MKINELISTILRQKQDYEKAANANASIGDHTGAALILDDMIAEMYNILDEQFASRVTSMLRFGMGDDALLHIDTVRRVIVASVLASIDEEETHAD